MMSKNYSGLGVEHHIVRVRKYGTVLQLDDGSQWDMVKSQFSCKSVRR
jgi:hypothetical protein